MNGASSDDRIVAPVRTGIALPPRAARRVRTHAVPHAELEDSRERAGRRQADDQRLQDAQARIAFHQADHAQDRRPGHDAVGVEHDHVFVRAAAPLAEIADVAGLEPGVAAASAIVEPARPPVRALPGGEQRAFARRQPVVPAVAQHKDVESVAQPGRIDARNGRAQRAEHALRIFVVHRHDDGDAPGRRLRLLTDADQRQHPARTVTRQPQQNEPDDGIPKADDDPEEIQREQQDHREFEHAEAAPEEHRRQACDQHEHGCRHEREEGKATPDQVVLRFRAAAAQRFGLDARCHLHDGAISPPSTCINPLPGGAQIDAPSSPSRLLAGTRSRAQPIFMRQRFPRDARTPTYAPGLRLFGCARAVQFYLWQNEGGG